MSRMFEQLACRSPSHKVGLLVLLIGLVTPTLTAHGDIHLSIRAVSRQIEQEPDNARLYFQRAQYYQVDRDLDNARTDYLTAQTLDPGLVMTHYGLAALHLDHGLLDEAMLYIEQFLAVQPDHPRGMYLRALIAIAQRQPVDAIGDIEASLQTLTEPGPEHFLLAAQTTLVIDSTALEQAILWLDRGEETLGKNIVLAEKYIEFTMYAGAYSSALGKVDEILTYFPRPEKWYYKKGVIYEMMGLPKQALGEYLACLEAIASLPARHKNTGAILALQAAVLERRDALKNE